LDRYINWNMYVDNDLKITSETPEGDFYKWQDCISGTRFFLKPEDYKTNIDELKNIITDMPIDDIGKFIDNPYIDPKESNKHKLRIRTMPFFISKDRAITFREAIRLYVLFAYIWEIEVNNKVPQDKDDFRKKAYVEFFDDSKRNKGAYKILEEMINEKYSESPSKVDTNQAQAVDNISGIRVKLLQGGSYKIKKYYLENNKLKDMRGASVLLDFIESKPVCEYITERYIKECVIYAGGGKVLCILPSGADDEIPFDLENIYYKYTISAQCAFVLSEPLNLSALIKRDTFNQCIKQTENAIDQRMKLKLYNPDVATSTFYKNGTFSMEIDKIKLERKILECTDNDSCKLCNIKKARYIINEDMKFCAGCMHKHFVGKEFKRHQYDRFKPIEDKEDKSDSHDILDDIKDNTGYISLIYADGNSFGTIKSKLNCISDLMYFSRTAKIASEEALAEALENSSINGKYEIIAVGGDDIFIITTGKGSIDFTVKLIKAFNEKFKNHTAIESENQYSATLSAGVCIGKSRIPIRILLDEAENQMSSFLDSDYESGEVSAKKLARANRRRNKDTGSLKFKVLTDQSMHGNLTSGSSRSRIYNTLLPYTLEQADKMLELLRKIKSCKISKSSIYYLMNAFENARCYEEAALIYLYQQARNSTKFPFKEFVYDEPIPGYMFFSGFFIRNEHSTLNESTEFYSPWRDIIDLWDFEGGGQVD
jgi:CRISPR-associated protein Cmr2